MQKGIFRRARTAAVAVVGVTVGLIPLAAAPAGAVEGFAFERLAGANRYETAVEIAENTFPDGAENVVLARDALASPDADALAGNYVAGIVGGPILITGTADLHDTTAAAIEDLGAETVYIMGGTSAISQAVEDELEADGLTVERVAGANRYATAADALNVDGAVIGTVDGDNTAFLARSDAAAGQQTSPDALSVGPESYAHNIPVFLTATNETPAETLAALEAAEIDQIFIVGGTAAISQEQEDGLGDLGYTTTRLAGANRAETAVKVAEFAVDSLGWDLDHIDMARGDDSADALAGGPHGGVNEAPLLINPGVCTLDESTETFLMENAADIEEGHIFGGTAAVCTDVETAAEAAAQTPGQSYDVDPSGAQLIVIDDETGEGSVEFTVSGVEDDLNISIFPCENVDGVSFTDSDEDGIADDEGASSLDAFGSGTATITEINGSDEDDTEFNDIGPDNDGEIVFTVTATEADCAIVVIWLDADNDGNLDVDENGVPTEDFAIAGPVTFVPQEAETGECFDGSSVIVLEESEATNTLIVFDDGDTARLVYDDADQFSYDGMEGSFTLTLAEFESIITTQPELGTDVVDLENSSGSEVCYSRTAPNAFQIEGDSTDAPTGVNAQAGDFDDDEDSDSDPDDVRTTWADATGGRVFEYTVYLVSPDPEDEDADECSDFDTFDLHDFPWGAGEYDYIGVFDSDENEGVIENVADGDYCAFVATLSETNTPSLISAPDEVTVNAVPDDLVDPTITDLRMGSLIVDSVVEAADVIEVTFSEAMDEDIVTTGIFRFTDADGEIFQIQCVDGDSNPTGDATCVLSGDDLDTEDVDETNMGLEITLVDDPTLVGGETGDGVMDLEADLTDVNAAVSDPAGNEVDLTTGDTVLDNQLDEL